MLNVQCRCGATYRVPEDMVGNNAKCQCCGTVFMILDAAGAVVTPPRRTDSQRKAKRARENALLAKYEKRGRKTLDDRIAERQKDALERERMTHAVRHVLIGIACLVCGTISYFVLNALQDGGVAPRIVWPLVWLQGQYWVPVLLDIPGVYNLYLAYWFLTRPSNVG